MEEPEHRNGAFFGKGKTKKGCTNRGNNSNGPENIQYPNAVPFRLKTESPPEESVSNGLGKSVFGRWLKDFRSSSSSLQSREPAPKPQRPVGRTLSANYKEKDRKKKLSRTMSANQKDRRKDVRKVERDDFDGSHDWSSGIYQMIRYNSLTGDGFNGYLEENWPKETDYRKLSFSSLRPERFAVQKMNNSEINLSALVSYLDEEGLKDVHEAEINGDQKSGEKPRHVVDNHDGTIMPASSPRRKSTGTNHYENHNSILLNERNKAKSLENGVLLSETESCPRITYPPYKPETVKTGFNYYNDHRYENLETTDYISWSSEKDDKFGFGVGEEVDEVDCPKQDENLAKKLHDEDEEDPQVPNNLLECDFRFGFPGSGDWCRSSQDVPEAPVRDPSSIKSIKYGPGHEKYPSWPGSIRAETGDRPQRSHSWTEKTNYPKEKVTTYARPHNKRPNPAFTQQLKTVMERCEKITPETYQKTMEQVDEREKRIYLPRLDREGNSIGDQDYMVPSPPERDKPSLTQADLDKYYQENHITKIDNGDYSTPYDDIRKAPHLTQADLEEYARSYDDVLKPLHQHQGSYAQSEGYHSYVSSSELTTTPFLDRLRRDSDTGIRSSQQWSEDDGRAGRDSVVTTSSGSASSSETLKWHGSMSDVSVASSSCRSRQLIAHSSRVPLPQRHHSESVLYLGNQSNSGNWQSKGDRSQQLKLFPVNTYTVQPNEQCKPVISPTSVPKMTVAERISELERQQQAQRFAYYDPEKRHKVSDPTLKAIQKKALLSFYERHQSHSTTGLTNGNLLQSKSLENWKEQQQQQQPLSCPPQHKVVSQTPAQEIPQRGVAPPPPPRPATSRRASCASDMSIGSLWTKPNHSYSCSLVGPAIIGPTISVDDWVPELPPKKPHLKTIPPPLPQRTPSPVQVPSTDSKLDSIHYHKSLSSFNRMPTPDLPPPPPPPVTEDDVVPFDEPLPPPPPEVEWHLATAVPRRSTPMSSGRASPISPNLPVKDCTDVDSIVATIEQNENARPLLVPDPYEIQYDQNAINAIMESNRLAEMQKKKHSSKGKHASSKELDEKSPLKVHIENRPPLPLPRDVQLGNDRKPEGCDRGTWQKSNENHTDAKVPFVRSISKPENATRASIKASKNDANYRSSLRYPSKNSILNGKTKDRPLLDPSPNGFPEKPSLKSKATLEYAKPFTVKKVSEYECRIPSRDRDGLTVFDTTTIDDTRQTGLHTSKGSNSKAAFLALRREKEMSMANCEGSYKLTVSPSGERIESGNGEKFPLEMMKLKEKSTENLVLDNRLSLEPPDLIPKIGNLNRKSSSAQEIRDNRKKHDYNCFNGTNDKYRVIPASAANGRLNGMFSENIIQNECKVTFAGCNESKTRDAFDASERIPITTVECVRAVITKLEVDPQERLDQARKETIYQSREEDGSEEAVKANGKPDSVSDKYGVSISLSRTSEPAETGGTGGGREKTPMLRVRSNIEKRLTRSDSVKSNGSPGESKGVERSRSLKLVERSTSFGKSDTMKVVGVVEKSQERRGNLSTSDASSQTDLLEEEPVRDEATLRKMEEELECEKLSRDLASQLPPSDKLQSLLVPDSERKKPTDYVANLFRLELSSKPRRKSSTIIKTDDKDEFNPCQKSPPSSPVQIMVNGVSSNEETTENGASSPVLNGIDSNSASPGSKFSEKNGDKNSRQLQKKKEELMTRLGRKLVVLKEEQEALTNESSANEELGVIVANNVAKSARPQDLSKYRAHVEEVGKITSLLLGLSGRLAKVENTLLGLPSHHDDRKTQESKRDRLQEQLAEAKQLKENIDKRSDSVAKTLGKHLNPDEYADYIHFIRMKAKLIVDLREVGDKISLGEEQLAALRETTLFS